MLPGVMLSLHPSRRALRTVAAAVVTGVLAGGLAAGSALADSTPAPTGPRPSATPAPCPSGQTPTAVTATSPRPARTPNPAVTTRSDGSTVTPTCAIAPPTPILGPTIAPDHTVGGPRLAGTGVIVDGTGAVPAPPVVTDVSWVISDLRTGEVLAAKDPHALLLPASTLKTLLALVTLPALPSTRVVRASSGAVSAEGTRVGLVEGAPYTVDQLFQGLVLVSGNDTAYALADAYGGRAKTLAAMNAKAAELGAWDTLAKDPSGLDEVGQRSSAYDLALFGRAVMALPQFRRYAVTEKATFPGGTDPRGRVYQPFQISNHNLLLENYPGTIGVKNGYTTGARHTFVGAVTRGGRTLLITEMGGVVVPSWKPTAALLDWAFAHASSLTPVGQLVAPGAPQPPEWRPGATATGSAGGSPTAPSTPSAAVRAPIVATSKGAPAPLAVSGPGGEPRVLTSALRSPVSYAALAVLLAAALGGWLVGRRRRRPRPSRG